MTIRVLCLGAYANGNLGDMYQPDAIATLVRDVRPDAAVTSISPSRRGSDYPAAVHIKGAPGSDPDFINGFDCLIVGGGGLFSAPHYPLADTDWVAALKVPIFVVSAGAAEPHPAAAAAFIRRCARFSVRDEYSYRAVASLRPDAEIVMDPILLADVAEPPLPPATEASGLLWVPGKIIDGTRALWTDVAARLIAPEDRVMSFNPGTDAKSGFDAAFGGVTYLHAVEPFLAAAAEARLVLSERYHGCIFALAHGRPAIGIATRSLVVTSKIRELYRRLGCGEAVVDRVANESRQSLLARAAAIDPAAVRSTLAIERRRLKNYLATCLA